MNAIERESTIGQVIIVAQGFAQILMFFPQMGQKVCKLFRYIFENFKEFATLVFWDLDFLVFLLAAMHYTENEYHIKVRLSRFLEPSTAVKEF